MLNFFGPGRDVKMLLWCGIRAFSKDKVAVAAARVVGEMFLL
jgi:hypothetical protein